MNPDPVKQERCELRKKQLLWVMDNFTEPVYTPDCANNMASLSDTFNVQDDIDLEGYNPCGITMTILNFEPINTSLSEFSNASVARIMRDMQCYLPKTLRMIGLWNPKSWNAGNSTIPEETMELMGNFSEWILCMKSRILNDFTTKYILGGKLQFLEIMKRRYKRQYSERTETTMETSESKEPIKLNINFTRLGTDEGSKS